MTATDPTLGGLLGPLPRTPSTGPAADSGVTARGGSTAGRPNPGPGGDPSLSAGPVEGRLGRARAEIARLRDETLVPWLWHGAQPWALAVLAAADATLDRHREVDRLLEGCDCDDRECTRGEPVRGPMCDVCGYDGHPVPPWPCPDVQAVLDLYAPEVSGG